LETFGLRNDTPSSRLGSGVPVTLSVSPICADGLLPFLSPQALRPSRVMVRMMADERRSIECM